MAGYGSQEQDPARRGSPATDGHESVHPEDPGARGPSTRLADLLRRFDDAFGRTFMAMAMAEDGTRELALEMLDERATGNGPDDERASDDSSGPPAGPAPPPSSP